MLVKWDCNGYTVGVYIYIYIVFWYTSNWYIYNNVSSIVFHTEETASIIFQSSLVGCHAFVFRVVLLVDLSWVWWNEGQILEISTLHPSFFWDTLIVTETVLYISLQNKRNLLSNLSKSIIRNCHRVTAGWFSTLGRFPLMGIPPPPPSGCRGFERLGRSSTEVGGSLAFVGSSHPVGWEVLLVRASWVRVGWQPAGFFRIFGGGNLSSW